MANNDPPSDIKNKYIRPDDVDIIMAYQLAGTGPRDTFCPRCLREADYFHRGNWAIACEETCLLCGRGGHKGAPCPKMLTVLGQDWLDGHWAEHGKKRSEQELQDALKVSRQTTGRADKTRVSSQGSKRGKQGGLQQRSISQSQPIQRGEHSRKRQRADDEESTSLADAPDFDPKKDARLFFKQCISRKVRALKKQQALTSGEESSRKLRHDQQRREHDQQKLDQRLKSEDLELQRDTLATQYQSFEQQLKKTQADYAAFVEQTDAEKSATANTISKLQGEKQRLSAGYSKCSILYKDAKKKIDSLAAENADLCETAERSANPDVPGNSQQDQPPQPEVKQERSTQQLVQASLKNHDDDVDAKPELVDGQLVGYEGDEDGGGV